MDLRVTFDRSANAAYISLASEPQSAVARTHLVSASELRGELVLDLDKHGRLLGIEVLNTTKVLPYEVIHAAQRL